MISIIVLALFFMASVPVCVVLVVSACVLSGQCRQAEEEHAARIDELEDAIRETLGFYQGEWDAVGEHPSSRYRLYVEYYQGLLDD